MRYAIALDAALRLFQERAALPAGRSLVAPTLLRSQALAALYDAVRRGELERQEAAARLDHMRALRIRLLGDRVQQGLAWDLAAQFGWADTLTAEYVALARLQADAFVTLDPALARALRGQVPLASFEELLGGRGRR